MERFKLFIENFVVYGLGSVVSKIVPVIMLPIITRLMPDTFYFGLNDMSVVITSFGSAFAVMGMYDAMFRMFFEKEDKDYQKSICSSAFVFTLMTSTIIFLLMLLFQKPLSELFFDSPEYANLLVLSAMSILIGATNSIVSAPSRMQNQRKIYLITNTLSPILSYAISIPLLIKGMYIIALPLAAVISAFTIEVIFVLLNKKWFDFSKINFGYVKEMLKLALPLMPNFLIYWVFNSSDKIMITKLLGAGFTGIYSIGGKVGQLSQLIYTAFASGWQYFAFSTMKDNDQVEMTSNIFEYLGAIAFSCSILMAACSQFIFELFFEGEYVKGYIVAPYLFLAPLLLMLFQVASNQFLIIKKTWPNMFILAFGAISNVVFNFIFIPRIGIEGAAFGTLIGYILSVTICAVVLKRMKLLKISKRFLFISAATVLYLAVWRMYLRDHMIEAVILAVIVVSVIVMSYYKDIRKLLDSISGKEKKTV